jgi:hypothetical protein
MQDTKDAGKSIHHKYIRIILSIGQRRCSVKQNLPMYIFIYAGSNTMHFLLGERMVCKSGIMK